MSHISRHSKKYALGAAAAVAGTVWGAYHLDNSKTKDAEKFWVDYFNIGTGKIRTEQQVKKLQKLNDEINSPAMKDLFNKAMFVSQDDILTRQRFDVSNELQQLEHYCAQIREIAIEWQKVVIETPAINVGLWNTKWYTVKNQNTNNYLYVMFHETWTNDDDELNLNYTTIYPTWATGNDFIPFTRFSHQYRHTKIKPPIANIEMPALTTMKKLANNDKFNSDLQHYPLKMLKLIKTATAVVGDNQAVNNIWAVL